MVISVGAARNKNRPRVRAIWLLCRRQEREKPALSEWGVMLLRLLADELHVWKSGCVAPIVRKDNADAQPAQAFFTITHQLLIIEIGYGKPAGCICLTNTAIAIN
jgi:hypothetical protein